MTHGFATALEMLLLMVINGYYDYDSYREEYDYNHNHYYYEAFRVL